MEAVTLKKLKKIRIGHNGSRPGSGWFLDKVVVQPADDPSNAVVFECNRYQSYGRRLHGNESLSYRIGVEDISANCLQISPYC